MVNSNNKEINKEVLNKKRKPRVHLEDLGLDPEKIKDKKFETIGGKVFLSKNKILTDEDMDRIRKNVSKTITIPTNIFKIFPKFNFRHK